MSALLLKDMYMLKKYSRSVLLMVLIFWGAAVFAADGNLFWIFFPVIVGSVMPATLLSYDEKFHWDTYCDTMPISRACVVAEKYVLTLAAALILTLGSVAAQYLVALRGGSAPAGLAAVAALVFSVGLFAPAVMLPAVYKFGVEKGRIVYYLCVGCGCAVPFILPKDSLAAEMPAPSIFLFPLFAAALFAASWALSTAIYRKKNL